MTDDIFDDEESERLKRLGMAVAAANRYANLEVARELARNHPKAYTGINADDVGRALAKAGEPNSLGPAAGSLFKGAEWEFTGEWVKSKRISNHSRFIRVWRLGKVPHLPPKQGGSSAVRVKDPPLTSEIDYRRASQGE